MELQPGDLVQTDSGDVGKVVHISRLTVFVAFAVPGKEDIIRAFLESEITKVDTTLPGGAIHCSTSPHWGHLITTFRRSRADERFNY